MSAIEQMTNEADKILRLLETDSRIEQRDIGHFREAIFAQQLVTARTEEAVPDILRALELLLQEVKADMQALACIDLRIIKMADAAIAAAKGA